jgi:hypothetical protein
VKVVENTGKKVNNNLPYKNVVVVGGPKCATMHMANFFSNSNFRVVQANPNIPNEARNMMFRISPRGWKYKFCKTPGWIFDKNALNRVARFIGNYGKQTLVLVCVREFNQLLRSWYEMRKGESPQYANITFDEFKQKKSWENRHLTYQECVREFEKNIIHLIELLSNVKCAKLVVIDQYNFINNSTYDIFIECGVDVKNKEYKYEKPNIKTKQKILDKTLFNEYISLLTNKTIQKYMLPFCKSEILKKYNLE